MQRLSPVQRIALLAMPLVLATAIGCKKPDKQVTYTATGWGGTIQYVDGSETWQIATVVAYNEVLTYSLDTVIAGVDTSLTLQDTVLVPGSWTYSFDAPHDGTAQMKVIQEYYATGPTTASVQIDGVIVAYGMVTKYGDKLSLHE